MHQILYKLCFIMMIVGFLGCSILSGNLKITIIGILLSIVNFLIFWR